MNENSKFERSFETVVKAFIHSRNRIRENFSEGTYNFDRIWEVIELQNNEKRKFINESFLGKFDGEFHFNRIREVIEL